MRLTTTLCHMTPRSTSLLLSVRSSFLSHPVPPPPSPLAPVAHPPPSSREHVYGIFCFVRQIGSYDDELGIGETRVPHILFLVDRGAMAPSLQPWEPDDCCQTHLRWASSPSSCLWIERFQRFVRAPTKAHGSMMGFLCPVSWCLTSVLWTFVRSRCGSVSQQTCFHISSAVTVAACCGRERTHDTDWYSLAEWRGAMHRLVWTPRLTRRIFSLIYTHMRGSSRVFVVRTSLVMSHLHERMCLFWLSSTTPLSSLSWPSSLSYHPVLPPAHQLHLPRCGGQIPCALSLMRTLAPLPSTTVSHPETLSE